MPSSASFRKRALGWAGGALAGVTLLLGAVAASPVYPVYNRSASLPIGLYWANEWEEPERGSIVLSQQPDMPWRWKYEVPLPQDLHLLKQVAGVPGDRIESSPNEVRVCSSDEECESYPRQRASWPLPEAGVIPEDHYYLATDHPRSFDSRYFGLVPAERLIAVATKVYTKES